MNVPGALIERKTKRWTMTNLLIEIDEWRHRLPFLLHF